MTRWSFCLCYNMHCSLFPLKTFVFASSCLHNFSFLLCRFICLYAGPFQYSFQRKTIFIVKLFMKIKTIQAFIWNIILNSLHRAAHFLLCSVHHLFTFNQVDCWLLSLSLSSSLKPNIILCSSNSFSPPPLLLPLFFNPISPPPRDPCTSLSSSCRFVP